MLYESVQDIDSEISIVSNLDSEDFEIMKCPSFHTSPKSVHDSGDKISDDENSAEKTSTSIDVKE